MICIKCKRKIDRSYGSPELAGCYCYSCAINNGLTQEQIERERYRQLVKDVRADTIKKMQERLYPLYKVLCVDEGDWRYEVDQIANELIAEGKNEKSSK